MHEINESRRAAASVPALRPVPRSLAAGIGCVLAQPLTAQLNIPHAATSAMDGWALSAGQRQQWRLRTHGADRPEVLLDPLQPGEAAAVVTGSPVPEGTHSVLRSEHGHIDTPPGRPAELSAAPNTPDLEPGRNIRPEAVEARAGDLLCPPGELLTPARAASAAVAGYDELSVIPRPRVILLLTGGEVRTSGLPGRGEVRDVFGLALPAMLQTMGAEVVAAHRLGDDVSAVTAHLDQGTAEVVITTGGTAHSKADVLRPALENLHAKTLVDSVDMRPGHPALLAQTGQRYVLGLPGNPLAGFTALAVLGDPLLRALSSRIPAVRSHRLPAGTQLPGPRRGVRLLPVRISQGQVYGLTHARAHMMRGLADADALAVVPHGGAETGDLLECLAVPGGSTPQEYSPQEYSVEQGSVDH